LQKRLVLKRSSSASASLLSTTRETRQPRPLPEIVNKTPRYLAYGILGTSIWAVVIALSFNHQRMNSSTVQGSLFNVRYNPNTREVLGDRIDFTSSWPWISGTINHLKGRINIKYDVKGDKGKGVVHFHTIRPTHDSQWKVLEFTVTTEDGRVVPLTIDHGVP